MLIETLQKHGHTKSLLESLTAKDKPRDKAEVRDCIDAKLAIRQRVGRGRSRPCVRKITERKKDLPRNLENDRNQTA